MRGAPSAVSAVSRDGNIIAAERETLTVELKNDAGAIKLSFGTS